MEALDCNAVGVLFVVLKEVGKSKFLYCLLSKLKKGEADSTIAGKSSLKLGFVINARISRQGLVRWVK